MTPIRVSIFAAIAAILLLSCAIEISAAVASRSATRSCGS